MKSQMVINSNSSWSLQLEAETPTEKAMLEAIVVGYNVNVSSTRTDGVVKIEGGRA